MINSRVRISQRLNRKSKLSGMIYRLHRQLHDKDIYKSPWVVKVKNILDKCGMSYLWTREDIVLDVKRVKSIVSLRLDDILQNRNGVVKFIGTVYA